MDVLQCWLWIEVCERDVDKLINQFRNSAEWDVEVDEVVKCLEVIKTKFLKQEVYMSSFQLIKRDNELDINITLNLGSKFIVIGDERLRLPEIVSLAMAIHDPLKWLEDQGVLRLLKSHVEDDDWRFQYMNGEKWQMVDWLKDFVKWLEAMPRRPKFGVE